MRLMCGTFHCMLLVILLGIADSLCIYTYSYYSRQMILQVCLHFARKLLRERSKWPVHAFMQAWQSSTPEVCPDAIVFMLHHVAHKKVKLGASSTPTRPHVVQHCRANAVPEILCAYCGPGSMHICLQGCECM